MGGRHLRTGGGYLGRGEQPKRAVQSRPRHRAVDATDEPETGAGEETGGDVPSEAAATRGRSFFDGISTTALIVAATGLVVLGMIARWASSAEETGSEIPAATIEVSGADAAADPGQSPDSRTTSPPGQTGQSPGIPTQTIGPAGEISQVLVVAPESDCGSFMQTRQELPTLTISVAGLCQ